MRMTLRRFSSEKKFSIFTWLKSYLSARATLRFFRSADRRGAGPRTDQRAGPPHLFRPEPPTDAEELRWLNRNRQSAPEFARGRLRPGVWTRHQSRSRPRLVALVPTPFPCRPNRRRRVQVDREDRYPRERRQNRATA